MKILEISYKRTVRETVAPVDVFLANFLDRIDVVVSDINGGEMEAVKGMEELLSNGPRLFLSCEKKGNASDMALFLRDRGYSTAIGRMARVYAWKNL